MVEEERPNIFTTSVANIMPGDHVDVRLRYVEPLRWEDGIDAAGFSHGRGPAIHSRDAGGWACWNRMGFRHECRARCIADHADGPQSGKPLRTRHFGRPSILDPGFEAASIKSVSHTINVHQFADGRQHVELATGATIPNKDFVLEVQQPKTTQPKTHCSSHRARLGRNHFLLAALPATVQPTERMPVEMLYMIDVSGSMEGTSIEQARGSFAAGAGPAETERSLRDSRISAAAIANFRRSRCPPLRTISRQLAIT